MTLKGLTSEVENSDHVVKYSVLLGNLPGIHLDAPPIQMTLQSKYTPYDNSTT